MSEPVTLKEAAELAGVSVKTLRRAIKAGKLPASKVDTDRGEAYTVDKDVVQEMYKGGGRPAMARNPMEGVEAELAKLREALAEQTKAAEAREKASADRETELTNKIGSLEDELHQVTGQLAQMQEQILKALPEPKKKPWWKVWGE